MTATTERDDRCDHDADTDRATEVSEAITEAQASLAYHLDVALDELVRLGCFPRQWWSSSAARNELCAAAAKAALQRVLTDGDCYLPAEARFLHVERGQ